MSGFGDRLSQRQKAQLNLKEVMESIENIQDGTLWRDLKSALEAFKKGVDADDARRKREDAAVQLRKATRDEVRSTLPSVSFKLNENNL